MRTKVCAHDKKGLRSRAYNFCAKLQRDQTFGLPVFIGTFPCYFCERRLKTRTTAEAASDGGTPPSTGRVFFPQASIHAPSCSKCASRSVRQERAASLPIGPLVGPSLNNNPLRQNLAKGAAAYGFLIHILYSLKVKIAGRDGRRRRAARLFRLRRIAFLATSTLFAA